MWIEHAYEMRLEHERRLPALLSWKRLNPHALPGFESHRFT
jgi:hypothetical protein